MVIIAAVCKYMRSYFHIVQSDIFNAVLFTQQIPNVETQRDAACFKQIIRRRLSEGFFHPDTIETHRGEWKILNEAEFYIINLHLSRERFIYFGNEKLFYFRPQDALCGEKQQHYQGQTAKSPDKNKPESF